MFLNFMCQFDILCNSAIHSCISATQFSFKQNNKLWKSSISRSSTVSHSRLIKKQLQLAIVELPSEKARCLVVMLTLWLQCFKYLTSIKRRAFLYFLYLNKFFNQHFQKEVSKGSPNIYFMKNLPKVYLKTFFFQQGRKKVFTP